MSASFYSQNWYRVANLVVRLRRHAGLHRHVYRGEPWYVLQDHVTGQFHRFGLDTQQIIGLMDGTRTLQQVWDIACERLGDDMPTQDEIIELVTRLYRANVIQANLPPDVSELVKRGREYRKKKLLQQLRSPLGVRIPLLDPERFLESTLSLAKPLYSVFGATVWLVVVGVALISAVLHWDVLTNNMTDQVLSVENLLALWFVYPIVKALHELGHAYAVKVWGGEVHEMGIMMLVFVPVPYVDASAASAFGSKFKRAFVGAAGIAVEVFIASVAMLVWAAAEPGATRAVAFNIMLIGGISTILFNGNPLLRFDAYYVLCDLLESPNLGSRGNRYVGYLTKRFLFGVSDTKAPYAAPGEAPWLVGYSVVSYVYRLFIMVAIVLFVASKYFFVGVALAIWSGVSVFLYPIYQTMAKSFKDPQLRRRPKTFGLVTGALLAASILLIAIVPMPLKTFAEGVVTADHDARLFAPTSGFVTAVLVESGREVQSGQPLLQCVDNALEADAKVLKASIREAQARAAANIADRTEREIIEAELDYLLREQDRIEERRELLTVRAPRSGRFVLPAATDLPGKFVTRGELLGFVVDHESLKVAVPVAQDDLDLVRSSTEGVEARFASHRAKTYAAAIEQQVPAASRELASAVLTTDGGGLIARDPSYTEGIRAFEHYFEIKLDIPGAAKPWLDERVYVLFDHGAEPLVYRWYRSVRRVFLRQFDV